MIRQPFLDNMMLRRTDPDEFERCSSAALALL